MIDFDQMDFDVAADDVFYSQASPIDDIVAQVFGDAPEMEMDTIRQCKVEPAVDLSEYDVVDPVYVSDSGDNVPDIDMEGQNVDLKPESFLFANAIRPYPSTRREFGFSLVAGDKTITTASFTPSATFRNPGPVCAVGPNGLTLLNRRHSIDSDSDDQQDPPKPSRNRMQPIARRSASVSISSNPSSFSPPPTRRKSIGGVYSTASKRKQSHRFTPLPKHWNEDLLKMHTKELNVYLKQQNYTPQEIAELKTCRRRIKNRGYTRQSRERKAATRDRFVGCSDTESD